MALIIGIIAGALRKLQRNDLFRAMWAGVVSAALLCLAAAVLLQSVGAVLEEPYEQIFEGTLMLLAAGVLTWMIFWMQRQARYLKGQIESDVRLAVHGSGKRGIFFIAFLAVLREGMELAIFFTAAALAAGRNPAMIGVLIGLAASVLLGWLLYKAALRLDLRRFFQFTSILLIFFAAGLVAHGVHEFNEIGLIPPIIEPVWDASAILSEESFLGMALKTLFGYNANPSLSEVLATLLYLAAIIFGLRRSQLDPVKTS